ncbi:MAG: hypothetical protein ACRCYU_17735 [Nocardioides sp.]
MSDYPDQAENEQDTVSLFRSISDTWQQLGDQARALKLLSEYTTANPDSDWALGLTCWLHAQQGPPGLASGIPIAETLVRKGKPWLVWSFVNTMMASVHAAPDLLDVAIDLLRRIQISGPFWISGFDPVGLGWNLMGSGRVAEGIRVMKLPPPSHGPREWDNFMRSAAQSLNQLNSMARSGSEKLRKVEEVARVESEELVSIRERVAARANSVELLIDSVTSAQVADNFRTAADRNRRESRAPYVLGLGVLFVAVLVAALPLLVNYIPGIRLDVRASPYSPAQLLGAHLSATGALAVLAGVLLARARGRDNARQRASDFATAMTTVVAYSSQIQDTSERQRFMQTMGQLVLAAHLQHDSKVSDESIGGLANLLVATRTPQN